MHLRQECRNLSIVPSAFRKTSAALDALEKAITHAEECFADDLGELLYDDLNPLEWAQLKDAFGRDLRDVLKN